MAGNIKGITIEFNGDTTRLDKALRQIQNNTKKIDNELKAVDRALKFNPTNVDLWRQKQELLTKKVAETKTKLETLKQAQAKIDAGEVEVTADEYRKLQRDIIVTENQVKNFGTQLRKVGNVNLRAASEQVKQLGSKLTAAGEAMRGISTAAAAVTASIGALTVKSAKWADDVVTTSKVYSMSTGELQKYNAAAELVDVSAGTIVSTHRKLERNMLNASLGSKKQALAFKELGIEYMNADGTLKDGDEVWTQTIEALSKMENETERDAYAMALMGRSATELNPLIEDGAEGYKLLTDAMQKYDLEFVDEETLERANDFNDQLDTIKAIGTIAFQTIGAELAGYLAPALEKVVDWVGKFANWLSNLDPAVLTTIGVIAAVVAAIAPVLMVLGKLAFAVSSIMSLMSTIGPVLGAIAGPIGIVIAVIAAVIAGFVLWKKHGDKIKKFFKDFGAKIAEVWDKIKEAVTTALEAVKQVVSNIFNGIKNVIMTAVKWYVAYVKFMFNLMKTIITTVLNAIKLVVTTVWNGIKAFISAVLNGIKIIVTTVWNGIKKVVTTVVNGIKTTVTTVFNAIKSVATTVWNGIKTAITTPIQAAKNTVSNIIGAIKNAFQGLAGIGSKVRAAFNKVKEAITAPIEKAKELVKNAIDTIKGIFPIKLGKIFSGVKLPHFKISGGKVPWGVGNQGTPPKVDIEWYAKGGIFNSPSLIGVGEAGSEAVVPLDRFWKTLEGMSTGETNIVININGAGDPRAVAEEVKRMLIRETNQRRMAWQ